MTAFLHVGAQITWMPLSHHSCCTGRARGNRHKREPQAGFKRSRDNLQPRPHTSLPHGTFPESWAQYHATKYLIVGEEQAYFVQKITPMLGPPCPVSLRVCDFGRLKQQSQGQQGPGTESEERGSLIFYNQQNLVPNAGWFFFHPLDWVLARVTRMLGGLNDKMSPRVSGI